MLWRREHVCQNVRRNYNLSCFFGFFINRKYFSVKVFYKGGLCLTWAGLKYNFCFLIDTRLNFRSSVQFGNSVAQKHFPKLSAFIFSFFFGLIFIFFFHSFSNFFWGIRISQSPMIFSLTILWETECPVPN